MRNIKKKNKKKFPPSKQKRPFHRTPAPHAAHPAEERQKKRETCTALFRGTSRGYGFATPEAGQDGVPTDDIFIPAARVHGALDGDRVLLRFCEAGMRDGKKSFEGEVVRVEEYGRMSAIGTFGYERGILGRRRVLLPCLYPDDTRLPSPMQLHSTKGVQEGDKIEVSLANRSSDGTYGPVLRVFGAAQDRSANYEAILASCGIPTDFPSEALREAEELAAHPLTDEGRERPSEIIFTIDGESAKDLDDAISLRALPGGGFMLGVHIADVSEYVRRDSALDRVSLERGTSVYFVDKVVPMLPEALSNGACSLNAGEDKYALAAHMKIDEAGNILSTRIAREIIRSRVRGVYSEVNDLLKKDKNSAFYSKYRTVLPTLRKMERLYRILEKKSRARGALDLDRAEPIILLDKNGTPQEILVRERGIAERMIEQFMLAANEGVATLLTEKGIPCVYRVHDRPNPELLANFRLYAHNLGLDVRSLTGEKVDCHALAAVLGEAKEKGLGEAVSYSLLRAMAKAEYSEKPSPHYGLGAELYCHFTSPIRRLSDLATHRMIKAVLLDGEKPARYAGYAHHAAEAASESELRALDAERKIEALYKTLYMSRHIGEEFDARISGVANFGMFAELPNTCEGLIPIETLDGAYIFDEGTLSLRRGERVFRVGDPIRVRVEDTDIPTHRVRFSVVGEDRNEEEDEELPDIYSFNLPYAPHPARKRRR